MHFLQPSLDGEAWHTSKANVVTYVFSQGRIDERENVSAALKREERWKKYALAVP